MPQAGDTLTDRTGTQKPDNKKQHYSTAEGDEALIQQRRTEVRH